MSAAGLVPSAARDAASATDAPPASASSTAMARIGVDAMLTRPTESPCTATPTMAQSMARLVNFWNDQPAAAGLGTPGEEGGGQVRGGTSSRKCPADGATVPDLRVADVAGGAGEQRQFTRGERGVLDVVVAGQCPDRDMVARVPDLGQM